MRPSLGSEPEINPSERPETSLDNYLERENNWQQTQAVLWPHTDFTTGDAQKHKDQIRPGRKDHNRLDHL